MRTSYCAAPCADSRQPPATTTAAVSAIAKSFLCVISTSSFLNLSETLVWRFTLYTHRVQGSTFNVWRSFAEPERTQHFAPRTRNPAGSALDDVDGQSAAGGFLV